MVYLQKVFKVILIRPELCKYINEIFNTELQYTDITARGNKIFIWFNRFQYRPNIDGIIKHLSTEVLNHKYFGTENDYVLFIRYECRAEKPKIVIECKYKIKIRA